MYIDSEELVKVYQIDVSRLAKGISPLEAVKTHMRLCLFDEEGDTREEVASQARQWLARFIYNPKCIGVLVEYKPVWKAVLAVQDDFSFLKLVIANLDLMWD